MGLLLWLASRQRSTSFALYVGKTNDPGLVSNKKALSRMQGMAIRPIQDFFDAHDVGNPSLSRSPFSRRRAERASLAAARSTHPQQVFQGCGLGRARSHHDVQQALRSHAASRHPGLAVQLRAQGLSGQRLILIVRPPGRSVLGASSLDSIWASSIAAISARRSSLSLGASAARSTVVCATRVPGLNTWQSAAVRSASPLGC